MSYGINHQVGIKASTEEIYKYLTETEKLAQWCTTDTRGNGDKVGIYFIFAIWVIIFLHVKQRRLPSCL